MNRLNWLIITLASPLLMALCMHALNKCTDMNEVVNVPVHYLRCVYVNTGIICLQKYAWHDGNLACGADSINNI